MRKLLRIIIIIVLLITVFHLTIYFANNQIAEGMKQRLLNCSMPENTQLLDAQSVAGKMLGAGNGMQWYGIILVSSPMDKEALSEWFYSEIDVNKETESIEVLKQESSYVFTDYDKQFSNYSSGEDRYQIRFSRNSNVGSETSFWESLLNSDFRGH